LSKNVQDSSNSGGESMYTMMKPVTGGNMPGVSYKLREILLNMYFLILKCCALKIEITIFRIFQ